MKLKNKKHCWRALLVTIICGVFCLLADSSGYQEEGSCEFNHLGASISVLHQCNTPPLANLNATACQSL